MTDVTVDMDDLDAFSNTFFQKGPAKDSFSDKEDDQFVELDEEAEEEEQEEVEENEDNPLATEEDEDESEDEELPEEEPKPEEKKKSKFQTRIDELVSEARVAQRERDALRQELENLRARSEVKQDEPTLRESLSPQAPSPDALNDKGEPIYPMGEFDPRFIADLTRFTIGEQMKAEREAAEKRQAEERIQAEKDAIKSKWTEKVSEYSAEHPDYQNDVQAIGVAFANIDQQLGEYLSTTIMQCDNGPAIMHYLSQNIGEAQKIVAAGPFAATLAIGKLDARFEKKVEEAPQRKRVSDAPPPPDVRVRGKGGQFAVRPDTDDLDAFEKEFFK